MFSVELPRRSAIALVATLALAAGGALAQPASAGRPKPPTVPLENLPPPPPTITTRPGPQPQVTTRSEGGEKIQEYRIHNRLYMMKVTPKHGKPYVLMDEKGDGTFTRMDQPLTGDLHVPQWVLMEF